MQLPKQVKASQLYYHFVALFFTSRPGLRPVHPAGVVSQEPIYPAPFSWQELQQHQVKVRKQEWRGGLSEKLRWFGLPCLALIVA